MNKQLRGTTHHPTPSRGAHCQVAGAGIFWSLLLGAGLAQAATFTVTTTADSGSGSLRQAIQDANALPGADQILFNVPGPGSPRIQPAVLPLPAITDRVEIDGHNQGHPASRTEIHGALVAPGVTVDGASHYSVLGYYGLDASSGPLAVVEDPDSPYGGLSQACDPLPAGSLAGKIALVSRGFCTFNDKVLNAQNAGALGVIVVNREDGGDPFEMCCGFPGAIPALMVRLEDRATLMTKNGQNAQLVPRADGLHLAAGSAGSSVRGLVINAFQTPSHSGVTESGIGVRIDSSGNTISDCFIGTDTAGAAAVPNANSAVHLYAAGNTVRDNLLSGNAKDGVSLYVGPNSVINNTIGSNRAGNAPLGNGRVGIWLNQAPGSTITGNRIANNGYAGELPGIKADAGSPRTVIQGNTINGNATSGITLQSSGNTVGGLAPGEGNLIAFNQRDGVSVGKESVNNAILGNSVHGNGLLGIDLESDGVTLNDPAPTPILLPAGPNLALAGIASQSTTDSGGSAARANDGSTDGAWGNNSVSHTSEATLNNWWEVQLPAVEAIGAVFLHNRADCCGSRLSNFRVTVYNGPVAATSQDFYVGSGSVPQGGVESWILPSTVPGDRVRVELLGNNNDGNGILSLAEVEVYLGATWLESWDGDGGGNRRQNFPELDPATSVLNPGFAIAAGTLRSHPNSDYLVQVFGEEPGDAACAALPNPVITLVGNANVYNVPGGVENIDQARAAVNAGKASTPYQATLDSVVVAEGMGPDCCGKPFIGNPVVTRVWPIGSANNFSSGVTGRFQLSPDANGNGIPGEPVLVTFGLFSDDGSQLIVKGTGGFIATGGSATATIRTVYSGNDALTYDAFTGNSDTYGTIVLVEGQTYDFEAYHFEGWETSGLSLTYALGDQRGQISSMLPLAAAEVLDAVTREYSSASCGDQAFLSAEGRHGLGSFAVHTDASGYVAFEVVLPGVPPAPGRFMTATASRIEGGVPVETSEFSEAVPADLIQNLIDRVNALTVQDAIKRALVVKLNAARSALSRSDTNAACGALGAFLQLASAQSGKGIDPAGTAAALIADATRIRAAIGCP